MVVENIVQSVARDIMAKMILEMDKQGLKIILHTHDEIVCEVPESKKDESLAIIERIMSSPDPRCPGLPMACEAIISKHYTK